MSETTLSDLAPERRRTAAPASASTPSPARSALHSLGRWLLAALHAHSRRQVELALGERVAELNQAIRIGAEARRHVEIQKE